LKFKKKKHLLNKKILPEHIKYMNVPVAARIKNIMINMERCRWISNDITKSKELIVVNIPAYELIFPRWETRISIQGCGGKAMNKTVILVPMKYIVFRPYWNVPTSILRKKFFPPLKESELLGRTQHGMEGQFVRQRPGPENSLGLVKFLFPIRMPFICMIRHPKFIWQEDRAFSHGCIRVASQKNLLP
jgi:murein L,D-transpeptidase YcbB/YkuD